jgi:hypothetical protein
VFEKESGDKSPHSIVAGELRVVFDRRGDRYGHRIERRIDGVWHVAIESLEGSSNEDWPPSPPLQTLHIERRATGPVALLVGKAGTSHWSASIEPLADQAGFQFDIACRVLQPPRQLISTYQSDANGERPIVDVSAISQEALCESAAHERSTVVRIRPIELAAEYPSTIRWRYRAIPAPPPTRWDS